MRTFIEVTQAECECIALIAAPLSHFYNIKANVELKPAIGRRLIISINPPLNSICNDELLYDGSKLPEDMVADWLVDRLEPYQQLKKYDVISSNKEELKNSSIWDEIKDIASDVLAYKVKYGMYHLVDDFFEELHFHYDLWSRISNNL